MSMLLCSAALLVTGAPLHRNYVYARFLRDGVAPSWVDFIQDGLTTYRAETEAALEQLAADHDVVLLPSATGASSKSYILMAHPFSNLPTAHVADHDRDAVFAALSKLTESVPSLLPRTFLKVPRTKLYGN